MHKHIILTISSLCFLGLLPVAFSFAQETEEAPLSDLAALSIVAAKEEGQDNVVADEPEPVSEPDAPPSIQETFNMQEVVPVDVLQATENPESVPGSESQKEEVPIVAAATTTEAEMPLVLGAATSSDDVPESTDTGGEEPGEVVIPGPASLEVVVEDVIAEAEANPDVVAEVRYIVPPPVQALAQIPLEEEIGFAFSLTGKQIPTVQRLFTSEGEVIDEKMIDEAPDLAVDDNGSMTVSGVCRDAYYVVLLYKEAEEYERDPRSYILNRAYPCTGTFTYAIDDVPASLPNGTYYLLIGEQGEVGEWVPITALSEITINRE